MHNRVIKTVDHPWSKVIIAVMSTGAFAGMGGGFWSYLQHREIAGLEAQRAELQHGSKVKDVQLQIAALVEMMAEQGNQLKRFKEALERLSAGQRAKARDIVGGVEIPLAQGKMILRGRTVPTYEALQMEQTVLDAELADVEEALDKH